MSQLIPLIRLYSVKELTGFAITLLMIV